MPKKTFRFSLPPRRGRDYEPPLVGRPKPQPDEELRLTGRYRGKKASDLEEVFGRALDGSSKVIWIQYQSLYGAPARNMAGAKTLDFLVYTGVLHLIQIDDEWVHKSAATKAKDRFSDAFIFQKLRARGAKQVRRIKGNRLREGRKASRRKADRLVEEIL